jgi:hypothetical protein
MLFQCDQARNFNVTSKRTTARKTSGKRRTRQAELRRLLKKAQAEVANLLKRDRAGTLTGATLKVGLEEIRGHLRRMNPLDPHG